MATTLCRECQGHIDGTASESVACQCDRSSQGPTPARKLCCRCRCDLAGKTRYHDHNGFYWCQACHEADRSAQAPAGVVCQTCHKIIDPRKVDLLDGLTLCGSCARERVLDRSRPHRDRIRQIYDHLERQRLLHLVEAAGALLLSVVAMSWFRVL